MPDEVRKVVLIVDDQPSIVTTLKFQVMNAGFNALVANSGEQAMKIITESRPDLVLLDVMMPRINGWEVCRRLKANPATSEIPVFMVTSLHGDADTSEARNSGANEFLVKPIKTDDLVKRIKKYLGSPFKV
jgi:DNA-binding response OmpR family regulator